MVPLNAFMKLHTDDDGELVLPDYAFALCQPNAWPFVSTMDLNILPGAYLTDDTPADSENLPEDPANTESVANAGSKKKQHKCKGRSKVRSKSTWATSCTSETSPGCAKPTPQINKALAKQVVQDLHLSPLMAPILRIRKKPTRTPKVRMTPKPQWTQPRWNPGLSH